MVFVSCAPARYETYPKATYAVASWYGPDFHGKPTSSGEIFNMYALTCAHRDYPFGTNLTVTNLTNNKSVNCIVNDRGPFVAERDLDLSYGAAKEIGLIGPGTVKVRIEYAGRDTQYVREVKYIQGRRGPFTIQIGSFKELPNASRLKMALELKYSKVYITEAEIDGSRYYRVRIGKFPAKEEASRYAKTLADEGYSVLITGYDETI
ncbi:MAG: septal ring lytic transglycosylase RlpA family protein [Nitrospirota bacterium]|nr:septal ring lytic transglycosylase RlpA family protein [Nitrospirota bacterium]MDH5768024.1 septal ring lytic transglycosylase RlpA family protein [Nitrospirota bacterium]